MNKTTDLRQTELPEAELLRIMAPNSWWLPALVQVLLEELDLGDDLQSRFQILLPGRESRVDSQEGDLFLRLGLEALRDGRSVAARLLNSWQGSLSHPGIPIVFAYLRKPEPKQLELLSGCLALFENSGKSAKLLLEGRFSSSRKLWSAVQKKVSGASPLWNLAQIQLVLHALIMNCPKAAQELFPECRAKNAEQADLLSRINSHLLQKFQKQLAAEQKLLDCHRWERMLGISAAFRTLVHKLECQGDCQDPVLLLGESGTGKELAAQWLHNNSGKRGKLVALNCASLPLQLAESELFGTSRGAFTGAGERSGLVDQANGGTLFLDEFGALDPSLQAKLLRLLDSGEYYRLGDQNLRHSQFRLICATNEMAALASKDFRSDLLQRVSANRIELPALRQRREDYLLLTTAFLHECGERLRASDLLETKSQKLLENYSWPGNIREFRFVIRRLAHLGPVERKQELGRLAEKIGLSDPRGRPGELRVFKGAAKATGTLKLARERAERTCIEGTLRECGGDKLLAARRLEISLPTLYAKLKQLLPDSGKTIAFPTLPDCAQATVHFD